MRFRIVSMALGLAATVAVATPAMATHNNAAKAVKFLSYFVRAYNQCTNPSTTHNAPLSFPACTPSEVSSALQFGIKGEGQAKGVVKTNTLKQATDVQLISKFKDIRVGSTTGPGFHGMLLAIGTIRVTDHYCVGGSDPCTMQDTPFPVPLPCGSVAVPPQGAGKCLSKTSANGVAAGAVVPGKDANVELGQLSIFNGSDIAFTEGLALK